ncbi:MAG: cytochrome c oxidase assembly protein subunit 15 [Cyclobacteriaceae bacterium]|jgi:cytochrome c oxidase assembly protein subunit 15
MLNKSFARKINFITIIAVYFLILVGGIVRNMESGMGCPDWPKCFGAYIPPTSGIDLPEGYQELYLEKRIKKNERLSGLLSSLGLKKLSEKVIEEKQILSTDAFSVKTAWVEYINRLIGVVIGLLIVLNLVLAVRINGLGVKILALSSFILVLFQGWIGSLVVSTNLLPGFISFHMAVALLLLSLLIIQWAKTGQEQSDGLLGSWVLTSLLGLFIIQLFLGINVREQIDVLKSFEISKMRWIEELDIVFYIHRSSSLVIVGLLGFIYYKTNLNGNRNIKVLLLVILVFIEVIIGAIMAYFQLPFLTQPFHLLFGSLAFGVIVYLQALKFLKRNTY